MKSKRTKIVVSIAIAAVLTLLPYSISYAALQGWDLVDSGKHLDWDGDTEYTSSVNGAVSLWEGYKSGIIRPDSASVIQDVYVSDYYEVSSTMGVTNSGGTIKFNTYKFDDMTTNQRLKTATHEFGHALGLDHTTGSTDVMKQGKFEITSLSSTDESSYDDAYETY